jgi:hypothetical protein
MAVAAGADQGHDAPPLGATLRASGAVPLVDPTFFKVHFRA